MRAFTRETISPGQAKFFIRLAAVFSAIYALFTLFFIAKQYPGVSQWNLLDVVLGLAVAVGILFRSPVACWTGFIYSGLNVAVKLARYPGTDPLGKIAESATFAMAIVCVGLYPRERQKHSQSDMQDSSGEGRGDEAV
jgi:hypothetical protein